MNQNMNQNMSKDKCKKNNGINSNVKRSDFIRLILLVMVVCFGFSCNGSLLVADDTLPSTTSNTDTTTATTSESTFNPQYTIEGIECQGNEKTKCATIASEYYQNAGEQVNFEEIQNAKLRLDAKGFFDNVDISLKKGNLRGNVIVLIKVVEGKDIKWNLSAFHASSYTVRNKDTGNFSTLRAGVSNLNFLGKGKILSANLTFARANSSYDHQGDYSHYTFSYQGYWLTPSLTYSDPHLFDSKKWFSNFNLISKFSSVSTTQTEYYYLPYEDTKQKRIAINIESNLELGMRFADFSYLSLEYLYKRWHGDFGNGSDHSTYFHYGWNSENDHLIPTEGSSLLTSILIYNNHNKFFKIERTLDIYSNYTKHYAVTEKDILSFQFSNNLYLRYLGQSGVHNEIELLPTIGCKYTNIFKKDYDGGYNFKNAAWYVNPSLSFDISNTGRTTKDLRPTSYSLEGGVILDTPSWVVKASLMLALSYPQDV
ncbi:MAG: hypothetical protein HQK51_17545 [Oligoflexia bacterium]|nr:hypothetical protein [Oligoflexia bacterium]